MDDLDRAIDRAAGWLLRELGTPLLPSQRALVRAALEAGYLYGEHEKTDLRLAAVGAAYVDASERLGRVPVIVRAIASGLYGVIAALDPPFTAEEEATIRALGGGISEDGAVFAVPSIETAVALIPACQALYERRRGASSSPPGTETV
ncbi:MAG: hypothetical protein RMM58_14315 [Chloroflexota bacterium]|nr:hypothetical protein [Dehalococcoidia bacterium]MDW8255047.1 hypothetical protein [Chloroflexota bacterium]